MLQQRAGIKMQHINYNGSAPALVDLIAGRVPVMFDIWHSAKRYVDTGQIKIIAGASAERLSDTPNTPAIAETYPGFAVMAMNALYGPSGIPAAVLTKVSTDVRAIVEFFRVQGEDKAPRHPYMGDNAAGARRVDA